MTVFYVLDLANNHLGSVSRAIAIIDEFAALRDKRKFDAAVKFQFRQLSTFLHKSFATDNVKHVARFKSTAMQYEKYEVIVRHLRRHGFIPAATPFDNESLKWIEDLGIDIVKVASCSVDDWPLLRAIAKMKKMVIMSTAGADLATVKRAYTILTESNSDVSIMHCVGEYPTPVESSNVRRIDDLRTIFPRARIGISTHESPFAKSVVPYAVAKGCTIVEKHIDIDTGGAKPNAYSCTPVQLGDLISEISFVEASMLLPTKESVDAERESLRALKRGIYAHSSIAMGKIMHHDDFYFAMPALPGQLDASKFDEIVGRRSPCWIPADTPVMDVFFDTVRDSISVDSIVADAEKMLKAAKIAYSLDDDVELSTHYGIDEFRSWGALIINKVNREYCKKLIVMLSGQRHPEHHHVKKEETFELLHGDCALTIDGKTTELVKGCPVVINRGAVHSFKSAQGCVIEEISTTHYVGDSVYVDPKIYRLDVAERKIKTKFAGK